MDVGSIKNSLNPIVSGRTPTGDERKQQVGGAEVGKEEAAAQVVAGERVAVSREQVESAVSTIQEFVQSVRRNVNFTLEDASGRVVVKVTDASLWRHHSADSFGRGASTGGEPGRSAQFAVQSRSLIGMAFDCIRSQGV